MNAVLVLPKGPKWPQQIKAKTLGADRIGWTSTDPQIDPFVNGGDNVMEAVRGNGWTLFLMRALWGWTGSPEAWALAFRDDLARLDLMPVKTGPIARMHPARQCALDADLEVDDAGWVLAALKEVRRLMPGRGLTWSFQPHKGGIMNNALVDWINADPMVTVAPFLYRNDGAPCSERWAIDDLRARGINESKILAYYNAWCEGWDGFLFDLDNLAVP